MAPHSERSTQFALAGSTLAFVVSLLGCSTLLGDPFSEREGDALATTAQPTAAESQPYLSSEECVQCLENECLAELEACQADDEFCAEYLHSRQTLEQPFISAVELLSDYWRARLQQDRGESDSVGYMQRLSVCAERSCRDACALGRDLACVGAFSYTKNPGPVTRVPVRVRTINDQPAAGWTLQMCDREDCPSVLGEATSDEHGIAMLDVDVSKVSGSRGSAAEQANFIAMQGPEDYALHQVWHTRPFYQDVYFTYTVWSRTDQSALAAAISGAAIDDTRGYFGARVYDCQMHDAKGVRFEFWKFEAGGTPYLCDDCNVTYARSDGFPDPSLREVAATGSSNVYADGVGPMVFVAREVATNRVVSVRQPAVVIAPDRVQAVIMFPATREQLAELPEAILHPVAK
jgi:hypothetical protein